MALWVACAVRCCFSVAYACAFTCARSFTLLSVRGVFVVCMCFSVSPPSSPYSFSFSNELLFSVTSAWTGAGFWWAGLVAGLWVGQACGVFYRPGFGLAVPAPRSLSTQPIPILNFFIYNERELFKLSSGVVLILVHVTLE